MKLVSQASIAFDDPTKWLWGFKQSPGGQAPMVGELRAFRETLLNRLDRCCVGNWDRDGDVAQFWWEDHDMLTC